MTTVLNAFSADHVFQLSDRKLVDARTFKQLKLANKTVLFADFFSFAFTGLAQLPLDGAWVDLDGWLLRALGPAAQRLPQGPMRALRYAFEEIRQKLDLAFADPLMKPVPKRWRGVTIVGAGWLFTPEGVAPATATISRCVIACSR